MLDTATRRRIDSARDILVGKVPDPKSQVEQITIALIYKFMDDMDAEAEELGGKRSFFAGEFGRYGWSKLMRSGLGGHETLGLYAEAITRMPENPGVPPLFRDIFKNAYLPYRDPETLRAFLKVIDEFEYDHSERLGDAFEYLLSVLGSQGDAGQFRTPRHIIDFIVDIVDPKKGDTILDPACGTAGFLISAWKHILDANRDEQGEGTLTPDERERLAAGIRGYDISPDMVRLSLANMYLHGFADPHIAEYDTLTSDERWNEFADVILANPPFMSPKGGIKPHNRFGVQSNRSEVLFVDYMAEHLTPSGRAGIIVPEGVIFQSGKSYKALRKILVEKYLVAVVSLPAGVFNPYSGVKTSILILDRAGAKASDTIAFFKVTNDGFGLGAQRREAGGSELPEILAEIAQYRAHAGEEAWEGRFGRAVAKAAVAASGEFNLSGDRYRTDTRGTLNYPLRRLGDLCSFATGGTPTSTNPEYYANGTIPWLVSGDIHKTQISDCAGRITQRGLDNSNARFLPKHSVLIALNGQGKTRGTVALLRMSGATCNQSIVAMTPDPAFLIPEYLFGVLRSMYAEIRSLTGDNQRSGLNMPLLKSIEIPLPPLEVQREIVVEIEGYHKVIEGARAVVENYHPYVAIDLEWPILKVGQIGEVKGGKRLPKGETFVDGKSPYPYIRVTDFAEQSVRVDRVRHISEANHREIERYVISSRDTYISIAGTIGLCGTVPRELDGAHLTENAAKIVVDRAKVDSRFLAATLCMDAAQQQIKKLTHAVGVPKLALERIRTIEISLPSIEIQRAIMAELDDERALVEANRELIARMERRIEAAIARVWGARESAGPELVAAE